MKRSGLDSCRSWVVAASCSLIFLLISWPMRLGAQLFVSMIDHYGATRRDASFPFALASLMRSLSGPFAGFFGGIIGLEGVTLVGCLFCTVGVGGCFFAEKMIAIDISLGIIYGIGFGWSTCLVPEIINQNFQKHRNKAYGLYFGGGGLGAFMSPPILEVILYTFGVSGTFLIMCGIILHSVPAALLLKSPKKVKGISKIEYSSNNETNNSAKDNSPATLNPKMDSLSEKKSKVKRQTLDVEEDCQNARTTKDIQVTLNAKSGCLLAKDSIENRQPLDVEEQFRSIKRLSKSDPQVTLNVGSDRSLAEEPILSRQPLDGKVQFRSAENPAIDISLVNLNVGSDNLFTNNCAASGQPSDIEVHSSNKTKLQMDDFVLGAHKANMRSKNSVIGNSEESQVVMTKYQPLDDSEESKCQNLNSDNKQNVLASIKSSLRSIDILWSPLFLFISSIQGVNVYLNYLFWTITIDMVRDKGIEQQLEVYFVMCLSLFDTAGRFFLGTLIDCGLLTVSSFCAACFAVMGLSCFLFTWLTGFYSNIAAICLLGLVFGGNTACLPGTITEFIRKEKRTIAMSSRLIVYVPMSFSMPVLIGYFRGTLGSYNGLLYVMTAISVLCAILCFLLPEISKKKFCRQGESNEQTLSVKITAENN